MNSIRAHVSLVDFVRRLNLRLREASEGRPAWAALGAAGTRSALKRPQSRRCAAACLCFLLTAIAGTPALAQEQNTNDILKLAPPYAELPPTFWELHGSAAILTAAMVLSAFSLTLWLVLRPRPVPPIPMEVQTRRRLEALQGRPEDGAALSEVSQILRRYFVAALGLPAGEFTTAEFCRLIGGNETLGDELAAAVGALLQTCDVRKFAPPPAAAAMNAAAQARELFERAEVRRGQAAAMKTTA